MRYTPPLLKYFSYELKRNKSTIPVFTYTKMYTYFKSVTRTDVRTPAAFSILIISTLGMVLDIPDHYRFDFTKAARLIEWCGRYDPECLWMIESYGLDDYLNEFVGFNGILDTNDALVFVSILRNWMLDTLDTPNLLPSHIK